MHLLMIFDESRLSQEGEMLNRLAIGLMTEGGIAVTRAVPSGLSCADSLATEQRVSLIPTIEYQPRILPWRNKERTLDLIRQVGEKIDAILVSGQQAWPLALDVSRRSGAPLMIDVYSAMLLNPLPNHVHHPMIAAYLAPTGALADRLRKHVSPAMVSLTPIGVPIGQTRSNVLERHSDIISMVALGSSSDLLAYHAFLGGLALISSEYPQVHVVMELNGPHEHEVWKIARRVNLHSQLTTFRSVTSQRSLLLQCDITVLPELSGDVRSILYQTMACDMPVIMANDPILDVVTHGESGVRIMHRSPEEWAQALNNLLRDPTTARTLGRAGGERVRARHGSCGQVDAVLNTIRKVLLGEALQFAAAG